jgi:pre-mycofactocin synthase
VLRRPRWLLSYAKTGEVPDLTVPNMTGRGEPAPNFFGAYGQWAATPPPAWVDVRWLRDSGADRSCSRA